jgi:hypothetical protein
MLFVFDESMKSLDAPGGLVKLQQNLFDLRIDLSRELAGKSHYLKFHAQLRPFIHLKLDNITSSTRFIICTSTRHANSIKLSFSQIHFIRSLPRGFAAMAAGFSLVCSSTFLKYETLMWGEAHENSPGRTCSEAPVSRSLTFLCPQHRKTQTTKHKTLSP